MKNYKNIVISTGAGISAESGISTFRDQNGLWMNHKVEDVASPQGLLNNRNLVLEFYDARRSQLDTVIPNAGHDALAKLMTEYQDNVFIITQNVDDLHERSLENYDIETDRIYHIHGQLRQAFCQRCGHTIKLTGPLIGNDDCHKCYTHGSMRPDVVFFTEELHHDREIDLLFSHVDLFINIGSSGNVWPAAGFVNYARNNLAYTIELNLEPTLITSQFDESRFGKATETVPKFVEEILSGTFQEIK